MNLIFRVLKVISGRKVLMMGVTWKFVLSSAQKMIRNWVHQKSFRMQTSVEDILLDERMDGLRLFLSVVNQQSLLDCTCSFIGLNKVKLRSY